MVTRRRQRGEAGFTLLEVMIALLVGMIGLIGTVAVQQTVLRATANANDAGVAMRLAAQRMEQFSVRITLPGSTPVDELAVPAAATGNYATPRWSTPPEYLDASGACATGTGTWTPTCRWMREWRVTNTSPGVAGSTYNISVQVTYNVDGQTPKTVRLDMERRKTF